MNEKPSNAILEAMERERARHLEQAAALERDMADIARLASKYNLIVTASDAADAGATAPVSMVDLIRKYRNAADSPYKRLTHASRKHYDALLSLIETDHGDKQLAGLLVDDFERWHQKWSEGGKLSIAHAKIGMVRGLFGFGTEVLRDRECVRLFGILGKLKFEAPKARTERLTTEQAKEIRGMARVLQRPSIALAQAFQSEIGMLQKDVIGEWVPVSEAGVSDITSGATKWMRGIRWNEIDGNLVLKHASESWQGDITFDLRKAPMVLEELNLQFDFNIEKSQRSQLPSSGPIVVSEHDGLPWDAVEFRRWWRKVATLCKIPPNVRNSDSRARAKESAQGREEWLLDQIGRPKPA
jgi:hypothetical protein